MSVIETRDTSTKSSMGRLLRVIGAIERAGNKLPHPFWLFWILAGALSVVSLVLALLDVSVTLPESGDHVAVKSLLSLDGVEFAASSALDNLATFPPLVVILVMLLGVSVAERSGLLEVLLRVTVVRLPGRWVTFAIAFSGMIAHIMSDSAYLVMIPLGALAFRAAGRSPVLGVMVAYVAVSAGFNASPLVTPSDAIRSSLATTAAQTVDPHYVITPVATYFFSAASSLLLAVVITVVVETVLARRPEFAPSPSDHAPAAAAGGSADEQAAAPAISLTPTERRALKLAAGVFVLYAALVVALASVPGSPLLGENGSIVNSVVVVNISVFIALLFALLGFVYGRCVGTVPSLSHVPTIMADGVSRIAPVIVLFFAVSQFLAYFEWTGIGAVLTVQGAGILHSLNAPHLLVLLAVLLAVCLLNMLITSGSAMWAILAPILVPMMMYLSIRPEAAQVAFMIGDSVTNAVTPMSPYFVLALGFVQQYRKDAGIGTLMSFTVPTAVSILIAWSAFFAIWYGLGIPLGPGVPLR
ncbi:AbgT family transporter [Streptomyces sp. NPDC058373]|uniref:AbgT family transporter n=1 Tax=Streptomyces sp. NPDC058373 TaxID=3346465 RepID=UPI00365072B4